MRRGLASIFLNTKLYNLNLLDGASSPTPPTPVLIISHSADNLHPYDSRKTLTIFTIYMNLEHFSFNKTFTPLLRILSVLWTTGQGAASLVSTH